MGDAFMAIARNGRSSAQGKKTNRPLRMPIEPSFSSVVFGQACPSRPQWVGQLTGRKTYGNGVIWR
jgi:hypothetical protein